MLDDVEKLEMSLNGASRWISQIWWWYSVDRGVVTIYQTPEEPKGKWWSW